MDPGTIIRLLLAPIQGAFSLVGTAQEHEAETDANYANQAELGRLLRAEQGNAVDVLSRGYLQAGLQRMAASQLLAKQQTAFANSGVLAGVGTPAAVLLLSLPDLESVAIVPIEGGARSVAWLLSGR